MNTSILKQYLQDIPKPVISQESFVEFHASLSLFLFLFSCYFFFFFSFLSDDSFLWENRRNGAAVWENPRISKGPLSAAHHSSDHSLGHHPPSLKVRLELHYLISFILILTFPCPSSFPSRVLSHASTNKLSLKDISNIFGAILMRPRSEDSQLDEQFQHQANIVAFLISNCHSLFRGFSPMNRMNSRSNPELNRLLSRDFSNLDDVTKGAVKIVVEFMTSDPISMVVGANDLPTAVVERSVFPFFLKLFYFLFNFFLPSS